MISLDPRKWFNKSAPPAPIAAGTTLDKLTIEQLDGVMSEYARRSSKGKWLNGSMQFATLLLLVLLTFHERPVALNPDQVALINVPAPKPTFAFTSAQLEQIKEVVKANSASASQAPVDFGPVLAKLQALADKPTGNLSVNLDPVIKKMTEIQTDATSANFDFFLSSLTEGVKIEVGGVETTYKLKVVEKPGEAKLLQLVAE